MAAPVVETKQAIKGGEFLIRETEAHEIFIPEQWNEEQRMIAQTCHEFLDQEVLPKLDEIDSMKDPKLMPSILDKAGELGLLGTWMALFMAGVNGMRMGNYITDHDAKIAMKIANVMCGGDLTSPQEVSEQYLLDLEREAFVSLCGEKKTLERIQSILTGGKPLRN
jgi:alkylation response protein AidB-like acyl-CoA dehydrogenase